MIIPIILMIIGGALGLTASIIFDLTPRPYSILKVLIISGYVLTTIGAIVIILKIYLIIQKITKILFMKKEYSMYSLTFRMYLLRLEMRESVTWLQSHLLTLR